MELIMEVGKKLQYKSRHKGSTIVIAIVIFAVVFAASTAIYTLSTNNTHNVSMDFKREQDLYVARAGIEMVYGALVQDLKGPDGKPQKGVTIVSRTGIKSPAMPSSFNPYGGLDRERSKAKANPILNYSQADGNALKITLPDGKTEVGNCDILLELFLPKEDDSKTWYYKITSTGRAVTSSTNKKIDGHTLTMFVYITEAGRPKVYDGNIEKPL